MEIEELLNEETIRSLLKDIESLNERLIEDYNGGEEFNQFEEDRLATTHVIEILEELLNKRIIGL